MGKYFVEADVEHYGEKKEDHYELVLAIEVEITLKQIESFNKGGNNVAFIVKQMNNGRFTSDPYLYICKVYKNDHPSENLGPFEAKQEAENILIALWQFCGNEGRPEIQSKDKLTHIDRLVTKEKP